ncbi:MAG TPA: DoxX family protein [Methylomirabilota bacterium]
MTAAEAPAWGATLLRLTLAVIYVMHGWYGLAVLGAQGAAGYIIRMGYPPALAPALAWYLIVVHLVGGWAMLLGVGTRVAALLQIPIMASALFLHHLSQGFFMRALTVETATGPRHIAGGYEYVLLVLAATLALALTGPGRLSVDEWRGRGPRLEVP